MIIVGFGGGRGNQLKTGLGIILTHRRRLCHRVHDQKTEKQKDSAKRLSP